MAVSSCCEALTVTNFRKKEDCTVAYPFPIITGFVTHPDGQSVERIVISRKPVKELDSPKKRTKPFQAIWPVVRRSFRGVVCLCLGENVFCLTAQLGLSEVSFSLTLFYEPAQNPENFVLPVYIVCSDSDGSFQSEVDEDGTTESAVRRISTGAGLLQAATAELLVEEGYPKKTFHLRLDREGFPQCEVFRTRLKKDELYKKQDEKLWRYLQKELKDAFPDCAGRCKFLSFLADTRYCLPDLEPVPYLYEDVLQFVEGNVALGGSSLALCGTGCLYTWPENIDDLPKRLMDSRTVDGRHFMDDSAYRGTRWACFATTLGAACHELGHTFDLGHEPVGIMARGFDDIYKVFTSARPASLADLTQSSAECSTGSKISKLETESRTKTRRQVTATLPAEYKVVQTTTGKFARQREFTVTTKMEPVATAQMEPKERLSLAAKMSGKFFSSSKKRNSFRNEEMVVVTRRQSVPPLDSLGGDNMDTCSIPSSCAISLFEPDASQLGESCNVSTISTRPSSMTSTATKSRTLPLLKRFSLGADCEQFTQNTAVVENKAKPAQNGSTKAIVTKHYGSYVVSSSSSSAGLPAGAQDVSRPASGFSTEDGHYGSVNSINFQRHTTHKEDKLGGHEKSHKSPWSRLFSSKKKKDRLPEFTEAEEQKHLSTHPADNNTDSDTAQPHPPTFQAGVLTAAGDVIKSTDHPVDGATDPTVQRRQQPAAVNGGTITTSDSEEPCSPDSLEEYHFRFDGGGKRDYPTKKYIATAISQDCLGEIRHVPAPPKNVSPPAVDGGGDSGGATTTPEPDCIDGCTYKTRPGTDVVAVVKPQPSLRNRREEKEVVGLKKMAPSGEEVVKTAVKPPEVRKPRRAEELLRRANKATEKVLGVRFDVASPGLESSPERPRVVKEKGGVRAQSQEDLTAKTPVLKVPKKVDRSEKVEPQPAKKGDLTEVVHQPAAKQERKVTRSSSVENILDSSKGKTSQLKTVSAKANEAKPEKVTQPANQRNSSATPQPFRYPVNDAQLSEKKASMELPITAPEPIATLVEEPKAAQPRARLDLRIAPVASRTKSCEQPAVMTGSLKTASKLRFPLRSQTSVKNNSADEAKPTQTGRNSALSLMPTRSTQSSRNKENRTVAETAESENPVKKEKTKSLSGNPTKRRSFRRKSLGRNSSRKKRSVKENTSNTNTLKKETPRASTVHLAATAAPSARLDFKQINEAAHTHAYPTHRRSGSRDSIGHLGTFLMTELDYGEEKDTEGQQDVGEENAGLPAAAEMGGRHGTLPRKQHCSSLINTPSGISVMEETTVPHRLPLPVAPPMLPSGQGGESSGGPKWTKNCAALLNHHKWFNPHIPADPKTPPHLDGHVLSASGGLRLIELRDVCGNVLQHWEYPEGIQTAPEKFNLPLLQCSSERAVVVAVDAYGNMLHRTVRGKFT